MSSPNALSALCLTSFHTTRQHTMTCEEARGFILGLLESTTLSTEMNFKHVVVARSTIEQEESGRPARDHLTLWNWEELKREEFQQILQYTTESNYSTKATAGRIGVLVELGKIPACSTNR